MPSLASAQVQQTREEKVRRDKQELQENDHWIYNDYAQARAEARKTGKPILAVIRCIP